MKTRHKLPAGYVLTLTAVAGEIATVHRMDDATVGSLITTGTATHGPYYFDTEWVSEGGSVAVAQTARTPPNNTTVASAEVLVAGVGTMTFVDGILTAFVGV